jgi:anti-sigma regulatory factor (Ser/Thr protein kinase)
MHQPSPPAARVTAYTRTYPGRPDQIAQVRTQLRELLGDCAIADDVILCASELATNAVMHSNSRVVGGTFTVRSTLRPSDYVLIEVEDDGGPWAPTPSRQDKAHGLDILRALASAWGVNGGQDGHTIWARFDCPT